jgi:hypothetical protein
MQESNSRGRQGLGRRLTFSGSLVESHKRLLLARLRHADYVE